MIAAQRSGPRSSTMVARVGGFAAALAGLCYAAQAVLTLVQPQGEVYNTTHDYVVELLFCVALLMTLIGLAGLRGQQRGRDGKIGTVAFTAAFAGTICTLVSATASLVAGQNVLGLVFVIGLLVAIVGNIVFGIAIFRAQTLPRWSGIALLLGLPVALATSVAGGGALLGLVWLLLGVILWQQASK